MGSEFCQAEDVQEFVHCLVRMLIVTEQRGVDSLTNGFHWLLLMYSLVGYTLAGQWTPGTWDSSEFRCRTLSDLGPSRISALSALLVS